MARSVIVVMLVGILQLNVKAQSPPKPIFTSQTNRLVNVLWSADANTILFQEKPFDGTAFAPDGKVQPQAKGDWHVYHFMPAGENVLTTSSAIPTQLMPFGKQPSLPPAADVEGGVSLAFPSPDNRYLAYAAQKPADWKYADYPLAIADLQTGKAVLVNDILVPIHDTVDNAYIVYWSTNSQAFVVFTERLGPNPRIYYVTHFVEKLESVKAIYLDELCFNHQPIYPVIPYDISADGSHLLLNVVVAGQGRQLFIWDAADSTKSNLLTGANVRLPEAAAFSSGDEQKVVYLDKSGLFQFDLKTRTTQLLDANLALTRIDQAWFSPDGSRIALLREENAGASLFVVDVPAS